MENYSTCMVPLFQVIFDDTDMDNTHKKEQKAEGEKKKVFLNLNSGSLARETCYCLVSDGFPAARSGYQRLYTHSKHQDFLFYFIFLQNPAWDLNLFQLPYFSVFYLWLC